MHTQLSIALIACAAAPTFAQLGGSGSGPLSPEDQIRLRDQVNTPGGADGPGYDLNWNTVDGGGATYLTGGVYELGATAGQPDAGSMSGGVYSVGGGFWYGATVGSCYANCDGSTGTPQLTANDFQCFLDAFAAGSPYANCDGSTGNPVLTSNDFQCFMNAFAAGCT